MVLAVAPEKWEPSWRPWPPRKRRGHGDRPLQPTGRLVVKYGETIVGDLAMSFLHDGRPRVVHEAVYNPPPPEPLTLPGADVARLQRPIC